MAKEEQSEPEEGAGGKSGTPWVPLVLMLLLVPVLTLVLTEFVIIPRLQSSMGVTPAKTADKPSGGSHGGGGGHGGGHGAEAEDGHGESAENYAFDEVIANLSGTMGTRFIKVSFEVTGEDAQLRDLIRMKKPRVQDAIISTLSSRTIQDIEVPGGRNALRIALIGGINQALGLNLIQELYFTEFIIQ